MKPQDPLLGQIINDPSLTELGRDERGTEVRNRIRRMFPDSPLDCKIFFSEKTRNYLVTLPDRTVIASVEIDFLPWVVTEGTFRRIQVLSKIAPQGPPRAAKLLLLFVPKRNREHLLGDLEEEYQTILLPEYGRRAARRWYWWQVCLSIGPFVWVGLKRVAGFVLLWKSVR